MAGLDKEDHLCVRSHGNVSAVGQYGGVIRETKVRQLASLRSLPEDIPGHIFVLFGANVFGK